MTHVPACRWERTTPSQCEFRESHNFCPHPEHACSCPPTPARLGHPGHDVPGPAVPTAAGYHKTLDDVHRQLERLIGLQEQTLAVLNALAAGNPAAAMALARLDDVAPESPESRRA
jgi:hypothetical protein